MRSFLKKAYYLLRYVFHSPIYIFNGCDVDMTNKIAEHVSIKKSKVGKYNYVARRCSLFRVEVGNYCCIGPDTHIGGMQHPYWDYCMSPIISEECPATLITTIGHDVWIGAGCIIKQGVHIGNGAVIGANSYVNRDVDKYSIVVGSPAKEIRKRFDDQTIKRIEQTNYWAFPPVKAKEVLQNLKSVER